MLNFLARSLPARSLPALASSTLRTSLPSTIMIRSLTSTRPTMTTDGSNQLGEMGTEELYRNAAAFYYNDYWGLAEKPANSGSSAGQYEEELRFVTALCNAAGGDGTVSPSERTFIKGYFAAKGYLPSVISKIDELANEAEKKDREAVARDATEAMTVGTLPYAAPSMLFDCIKAASKDGLDKKEWSTIEMMAEKMGLSNDHVKQLRDLVEEEEALKKKRIALGFPNGHPVLEEKYKSLFSK